MSPSESTHFWSGYAIGVISGMAWALALLVFVVLWATR